MQTVLITGASRGLGATIKNKFESQGYNVICPSRDELDLVDSAQIGSYFDSLSQKVDVLVNNAAINIKSSLDRITDENIEEMVSVNLKAPLHLMRYVMRDMARIGHGRVVNIGSIWGVRSLKHRTLYSMTKFGIDGMTRALAREFGPQNVLLNTIAPGFMATEMTDKNLSPAEQQEIIKDIPLGRFAKPEELAELVFFLCSPKNTYITGQTIVADGGFLA